MSAGEHPSPATPPASDHTPASAPVMMLGQAAAEVCGPDGCLVELSPPSQTAPASDDSETTARSVER